MQFRSLRRNADAAAVSGAAGAMSKSGAFLCSASKFAEAHHWLPAANALGGRLPAGEQPSANKNEGTEASR